MLPGLASILNKMQILKCRTNLARKEGCPDAASVNDPLSEQCGQICQIFATFGKN